MEKGAWLVKWNVVLSKPVQKQLYKLGRSVELQVSNYLTTRLATEESPGRFGKP